MVVARDAEEAAQRLRGGTSAPVRAGTGRTAAFLFPGQGAQYPGMAAGLYDTEPVSAPKLTRARRCCVSRPAWICTLC